MLEFEEDNALKSTLYESNIISDHFNTAVIILLRKSYKSRIICATMCQIFIGVLQLAKERAPKKNYLLPEML